MWTGASFLFGWLKRQVAGLWRGLKEMFWGLYRQDAWGLAQHMAFSAFFSLFPFLLLLYSLAAYFPWTGQIEDWLLGGLRGFVGEESELYRIVSEKVFLEVGALSATLLSVGIILTLWSASGVVMTLLKVIQRSYNLEEDRSWQKRRALAVVWSIAGALVIPAGILLLVWGHRIGNLIGERTGTHSALHLLWIGLRWPALFILLVGLLAVFFRHGSSVRHRWVIVLPGSVFSVGAIIGSTVALSWAISQSWEVRWLTYGVIGTAIVLLFWFFLVALVFLIGAQMNAVVFRSVEAHRRARKKRG